VLPRICLVLLSLELLSWSVPSHADVLYRKATPIATGNGQAKGALIGWRNCNTSSAATSYHKPPYSFYKGDDCDIVPQSFGLKRRSNGQYEVANVNLFSRFFPDASPGNTVEITEADGALLLSMNGRVMQLAFKRPPELIDAFTNDVSLAIGSSKQTTSYIKDANDVLTEARPDNIFSRLNLAVQAADMLTSLTFWQPMINLNLYYYL
jgi:hypothetical protein